MKIGLELFQAQLFVPKAQDSQSRQAQDFVSFLIGLNLEIVNGSIQLDGQSMLSAVEIQDEIPEDLLPAEFEPKHSAIAQHLPSGGFRGCASSPKPTGQERLFRLGTRILDHPFSKYFLSDLPLSGTERGAGG